MSTNLFAFCRTAWIASLFVSVTLSSGASAIELNRADCLSIHPTAPTEVTFVGLDLRDKDDAPVRIWSSFPAKIEAVETDEKPDRNVVRYRISPESTVSGIVAFRAFSEQSVSKPLLMLADAGDPRPLREASENPVAIPATLEADSQGLGEHIVAIQCKKDQPFIAEVIAARIGSEMDGVMILLDRDHQEITYCDDHPVAGADPILRYTPKYDGVHYLVVRDVQYRGGYRFQLRLASRTISSILSPVAIRVGETRSFVGSPVASASSQAVDTLMTAASDRWYGAGNVGDGVLTRVLHTDLPVYEEGQCETLPVPSMFVGRLSKEAESDSVLFAVAAGDRITIDVHTDQIGSPVLPHLQLSRDDGGIVAEHNWAQDPVGMIRQQFTDAGLYRIVIRDVLRRGGPHFGYSLSIRKDVAPLTLKLRNPKKKNRQKEANRFVTTEGQPIELTVGIERRGYDGPIHIVARMEDGMACQVGEAQVKEKKNEAQVQVTFPISVDQPTLRHFRVWAECEIDGRRYSTPLDFSEFLSRDVPKSRPMPGCVTSYLPVVVTPRPPEDDSKSADNEVEE